MKQQNVTQLFPQVSLTDTMNFSWLFSSLFLDNQLNYRASICHLCSACHPPLIPGLYFFLCCILHTFLFSYGELGHGNLNF